MATWQEEGWMDGSEEVMLCFPGKMAHKFK